MLVIKAEQIEKIRIESDKLKGTEQYHKYYMSTESKTGNAWKFLGWYTPSTNIDGFIKKVKDNVYLIINDERYKLQDVHIDLLNIDL